MKKIISIMLALVLALSMTTIAFATEAGETPAAKENKDATFSKTYKLENAGTSNPEETFTFTFTADHVTDSNANLTTAQMPKIDDATVEFAAGDATDNGLEKSVTVALSNVQWPGVGVYYYKVSEKAGTTAGVTYDDTTANLKVTVAYDQGTDTYYTAFVTLNLDEKDDEGNTKVKTYGFTNVYSAGSLSISKQVTGNMGDQKAYFAVDVTLTAETGKTNYQETYIVSGGSHESNPKSIKLGEKTTFYLKHDETITISNLPYGVTYTVVEGDYTTDANGKYDEAQYDFSDTAKKIDSAADTVTITNNKGIQVDTGIGLDSLPYVLMLVVVCSGAVVFFSKKRASREN